MEKVILVNSNDEQTGEMEKIEAHTKALLHRAFSVFIFNSAGEMLLQKRSSKKYHSAGLWTNACCSHPRPGETTIAAASRRLKEELGIETPLKKIFHFIYKTTFDNGLAEHEFDHVYLGIYNEPLQINNDEVSECKFMHLQHIQNDLHLHSAHYTVWFHIAFPKIIHWLKANQQ